MDVVAASLGASCFGPAQQAFLDQNAELASSQAADVAMSLGRFFMAWIWFFIGTVKSSLCPYLSKPAFDRLLCALHATLSPRLDPQATRVYLESIKAPCVEPQSFCIAVGDDCEGEWNVACGSDESDPWSSWFCCDVPLSPWGRLRRRRRRRMRARIAPALSGYVS